MKTYLDIVEKILNTWQTKEDRTWTGVVAIAWAMFEHDMKNWFPMLTTKRIPFRLVASELEFFIKWITDKQRLIDRNNHIRDERCSPDKVPYWHDEETKKKMMEERDLWPVYWFQRRNFWADYTAYNKEPKTQWIDQLKDLIQTLKTNPTDRRMIVMARNPTAKHKMAIPPCHYGFQVTVIDWRLNLLRNQRSVDVALWLPFNIASYALLLHLLAKEVWLKEWKLVWFLADTHIYSNHIEWMKEQLTRTPKDLPTLKTNDFKSIFERTYTDSEILDYNPEPRIKFDIAV